MEKFLSSKTFVLSKIIFFKNIFVFLHKLCKLRLICIDTVCLHADFSSDQPKEYLCQVKLLY